MSGPAPIRPPPVGRIDPAIDPDRPSRATAAALVPPSSRHPPSSPPPPSVSLPTAPLAMTTRPAHTPDISSSAKTSTPSSHHDQQTVPPYSSKHLTTDLHKHHDSSLKPSPPYTSTASSDSTTQSDMNLKHSSTLPVMGGSIPSLASPAPWLTPTSGKPHPTRLQNSPSFSPVVSGHRDLAPAQTRNHSYQSSILKNLLSS